MPGTHETARAIDVHQHLWPDELVDRLRARSRAPYLRGWTLYTDGEPPYDVDPTAHDVATRVAADRETGVTTACLSLSAPLGIERLSRPEAQPLIDAWHRGVRELPDHFRAWASVPSDGRRRGRPGSPAGRGPVRRAAAAGDRAAHPVRLGAVGARAARGAELAGKPVFVHPGPEAPTRARRTPARVVGAGGRLHRPAPGGVVGLARVRGTRALPAAEGALRCRRRAGAGAPRAPRAARRRVVRRSTRTCSSTPPARARVPWRPSSGSSASTRSCSAATVRTASRWPSSSGTPPPTQCGSPTRAACSAAPRDQGR